MSGWTVSCSCGQTNRIRSLMSAAYCFKCGTNIGFVTYIAPFDWWVSKFGSEAHFTTHKPRLWKCPTCQEFTAL